jgi:hypothetical protein
MADCGTHSRLRRMHRRRPIGVERVQRIASPGDITNLAQSQLPLATGDDRYDPAVARWENEGGACGDLTSKAKRFHRRPRTAIAY